MILFFTFLFGMLQTDTLKTDTLIIQKSILYKTEQERKVERIKYKHPQGFFCDFEDKINRNNKINLNFGVGEQ